MIRFYYTNAPKFLDEQPDPKLSLGSYISSSLVPNDVLSNLFGEITGLTRNRDEKITKVIVLKNESGGTISNIQAYFQYPTDAITKLKIGAVQPSQDSCGDLLFEQLPTKFASPYSVNLTEADGQSNAVSLGSLNDGDYLGIFLQRELTNDGKQGVSCDELNTLYENDNELSKLEDIILTVEWS